MENRRTRWAIIDVEVSMNDHKIHDIGALRYDGAIYHGCPKNEFLEFINNVDYLCGHNIINHDAKYLFGSESIKWILVDECQFLTEEQIDQLSDIVDYLDVNVICYGLRTDFKSKLFPASKRLFELADDIEEVKTSCDCGERASINARFNNEGKIITEGSQILVGGDDLYHAICRKDWKELIRKK